MTLEEYKSQSSEIAKKLKNFKGTKEDVDELAYELEKNYPVVTEFNRKAMQCDNLKDFSKLADSFGMKFSSSKSEQSLFELLQKAAKINKPAVNGELDDDALAAVTGGELFTGLTATVAIPYLMVAQKVDGSTAKQLLKEAWKDTTGWEAFCRSL